MKKIVFVFAFAMMLTSCKKEESKYQKTYDTWKSEMNEISNGHDEALSIMDGFQQKIDNHKKRISEFSMYISDVSKKGIKGAELEKEILSKCNENFKKTHTFYRFF